MNPDGTYGTIDEFRDHLAMLLDCAQNLDPALVRVKLSLALQTLMDLKCELPKTVADVSAEEGERLIHVPTIDELQAVLKKYDSGKSG